MEDVEVKREELEWVRQGELGLRISSRASTLL